MTERSDASDQDEAPELKGFDDYDLLLGDIMRGERATLGKSLLDVQRELKIKAAYIAAIENSDPSVFDTPGFIAGYVRSYARYLGLDPDWAFKTFCEEGNYTVPHGMSAGAAVRQQPPTIKGAKPETSADGQTAKPAPITPRDPFTQPAVSYLPKSEAAFSGIEPRAIGSVLVLIALLGGIGYGGWAVLQEVQKVRFTPVEQTPEVLAVLDPLAPVETPEPTDEGAEAGLPEPSVESFARLYRPEALDVPVLVARDGPISAIDPQSVGALAPEAEERRLAARDPRPDNIPFATPGELSTEEGEPNAAFARLDAENLLPSVQVVEASAPSVALLAVRPSWVRVRGADGTVIFEKILNAGEQFDVPLTEEPATLRAGNAGSLYFAVNGQTYGPAGDGPVVVKGVELSPEALTGNYVVADVERDTDLARFIAVAEAEQAEPDPSESPATD